MRRAEQAQGAADSPATWDPVLTDLEESRPGKTVVLCLGNEYMKDDGIGPRVAAELAKVRLGEAVTIDSLRTIDLTMLSLYAGARKVIVVDALSSGSSPGTVSKYAVAGIKDPVTHLAGSHTLRLCDMFDVASQARLLTCPVAIIGVEPKDSGVGEGLSDEVEGAIPEVIAEVRAEIAKQVPSRQTS
jgi:hydrogenase maturation protease